MLRRKAASATARLAVVAAATILAGIAYAGGHNVVVVSGDECKMRTTQTYNAATPTELDNQCSIPLLIEAIDTECGAGMGSASGEPDALPNCVVGQILAGGAACHLLACL